MARLESAIGKHSPSFATLKRYASALGYRLQVRLVKIGSTGSQAKTTTASGGYAFELLQPGSYQVWFRDLASGQWISEWYGNVAGEAVPLPPSNALRAVRVTIVARTTRQFSGVNAFVLKALEDRAANSTTDNFRRRILSTTVEIRNLSGSP